MRQSSRFRFLPLVIFASVPLWGCVPTDETTDSGTEDSRTEDSGTEDSGSEDTGTDLDDADGDGVSTEEDCDDTDPELLARADDGDCDGSLTEDDCDDANPEVYPGAEELCNKRDDDCDGSYQDEFGHWYVDEDGDGYGAGSVTVSCEPLDGRVEDGTDCDDADSSIHPGASEVCDDASDNDCDGLTDIVDPTSDMFGSYVIEISTWLLCDTSKGAACSLNFDTEFALEESVLFEVDWGSLGCDPGYTMAHPDEMVFVGSMDADGVLLIHGADGDTVDCAIWGGVCDGDDEWIGSTIEEPGECKSTYTGVSEEDEDYGTTSDCAIWWDVHIEGIP